MRLVAGAQGRRVGNFGLFRRPPLTELVSAAGDSATHYAANFERRWARGQVLSLVGGLALAGGYLLSDASDHRGTQAGVGLGVAIVGGVLFLAGGASETRSRRDLSRAVWWYNRSLAR